MGILPTSFWGGWAAVITAGGLIFLTWLAVGVFRARGVKPPPDIWDDNLREGNSEPPKWWFMALFGFLIFSASYILLYPGFGDNTGILNWNQHKQLKEGLAYYQQRTQAIHQRWESLPLAQLREDKSAMDSARRLFASNCAACHGAQAAGQAGVFPNLIDDEWQWGADEEQVLHSIAKGRVAAMPGWSPALSSAQIEAMADYLIDFNAQGAVAEEHREAHEIYLANCAVCHGQNGEGNIALGASRLKNHHWLYTDAGGVRAGIIKTLREGRNGIMPAQEGRLTKAQMRLLAAWLTGGMAIAAPLGSEAVDSNNRIADAPQTR